MLEKKSSKILHKWIGIICLLTVLAMDFGGYAMSHYSKLQSFSIFSIIFASPWVFWVILIYFSANRKLIAWHRYFGNMFLKGCISVPMARTSGAFF